MQALQHVHSQKITMKSIWTDKIKESSWQLTMKLSLGRYGLMTQLILISLTLMESNGGRTTWARCMVWSLSMVCGWIWMRLQISVSVPAIKDRLFQNQWSQCWSMSLQGETSKFSQCPWTHNTRMARYPLTLIHCMALKRLKWLMNGSEMWGRFEPSSLKGVLLQAWANMVLDGWEIISLKRSSWSSLFLESCSWAFSVFPFQELISVVSLETLMKTYASSGTLSEPFIHSLGIIMVGLLHKSHIHGANLLRRKWGKP